MERPSEKEFDLKVKNTITECDDFLKKALKQFSPEEEIDRINYVSELSKSNGRGSDVYFKKLMFMNSGGQLEGAEFIFEFTNLNIPILYTQCEFEGEEDSITFMKYIFNGLSNIIKNNTGLDLLFLTNKDTCVEYLDLPYSYKFIANKNYATEENRRLNLKVIDFNSLDLFHSGDYIFGCKDNDSLNAVIDYISFINDVKKEIINFDYAQYSFSNIDTFLNADKSVQDYKIYLQTGDLFIKPFNFEPDFINKQLIINTLKQTKSIPMSKASDFLNSIRPILEEDSQAIDDFLHFSHFLNLLTLDNVKKDNFIKRNILYGFLKIEISMIWDEEEKHYRIINHDDDDTYILDVSAPVESLKEKFKAIIDTKVLNFFVEFNKDSLFIENIVDYLNRTWLPTISKYDDSFEVKKAISLILTEEFSANDIFEFAKEDSWNVSASVNTNKELNEKYKKTHIADDDEWEWEPDNPFPNVFDIKINEKSFTIIIHNEDKPYFVN